MKYNAIVDCNYTGIQGAIVNGVRMFKQVAKALDDANAPCIIFIKNGRYYEKLTIDKSFITFIGESRDKTILTFDAASGTPKPDGTTYTTWGCASITVHASDFRAENLTIENGFDFPANAAKAINDPTRTTDPQAVALKTDLGSQRAIFKRVNFIGCQDTLFANSGTQYFYQCAIAGNIDFIFGAGQAVFDDCDIVSRDRGYITAASTASSNPYGFLFIHCRLSKEQPIVADAIVTLGRPWHPTTDLPEGTRAADLNAIGCVVYKNCWMDSHIAARGWDKMHGRDKDGKTIWFYPRDARFFECGSTGPGAIASQERRILSANEAANYSVTNVLGGWAPVIG
jgi:pectinesterase